MEEVGGEELRRQKMKAVYYKRLTEQAPLDKMLESLKDVYEIVNDIETAVIGNDNILELSAKVDDIQIAKLNESLDKKGFVNDLDKLAARL